MYGRSYRLSVSFSFSTFLLLILISNNSKLLSYPKIEKVFTLMPLKFCNGFYLLIIEPDHFIITSTLPLLTIESIYNKRFKISNNILFKKLINLIQKNNLFHIYSKS